MAKITTRKEKEIYNMAIKKAAALVKVYDGIIPDEYARGVIVNVILNLKKKTPSINK